MTSENKVLGTNLAKKKDAWSDAVHSENDDFYEPVLREGTPSIPTDHLLGFAIDHVCEAVLLIDEAANLLYVNEKSCRLLGYDREELLNTNIFSIAPEIYPPLWHKHWQMLSVSGKLSLQTLFKSKDASFIPVEINSRVLAHAGQTYQLALVQEISTGLPGHAGQLPGEATLHALLENSPDAIARYDRECRCLYVNPAFCSVIGKTPAMLLGKRPTAQIPAGNLQSFEAAALSVLDDGQGRELELVWPALDCRTTISHFRLTAEFAANGQLAGILAIGRDISSLKESERRLQRAEAMACIGHWQWDCRHDESVVSAEVCRIFGFAPDKKASLDDILATSIDEDHERVSRLLREAYAESRPEVSYTHRIQRDTEIIHLHTHVDIEYTPENKPCRLIGTTQDISELKRYESRLYEVAFHDTLTGLPNRALLNERLSHSLNEAAREKQLLGLLVLDLDRFKEINDIHGHSIGDRLLHQVGQRLADTVRDYDMVARLGGDEFAIILSEFRQASNLGNIARKLLDTLARPFRIEQQELFISASIGIAAFPLDANTADNLLQYADMALYDAKARGKACFRYYSSELTARSKDRSQLETALRHAEPAGELELYYQPKINLSDGRLVGAEALLRWHHPTLGMVPPDRFISIAEDSGLIVGIGAWVLTKACLAIQHWNQQGGRDLKMAVNLSPRQFRDDDLVATVSSVLSATDCEARWLELEITESLLLDNDEGVHTTLETFRKMGISIAIDDFGTGYSALGYLKRFPIDVLKIDRSFTQDVMRDHDSTELVKAIITMARGLGLELVAEGVETEAQQEFLQTHGCHLGQGYLYSKPIPKNQFEALPQMSRILAT